MRDAQDVKKAYVRVLTRPFFFLALKYETSTFAYVRGAISCNGLYLTNRIPFLNDAAGQNEGCNPRIQCREQFKIHRTGTHVPVFSDKVSSDYYVVTIESGRPVVAG